MVFGMRRTSARKLLCSSGLVALAVCSCSPAPKIFDYALLALHGDRVEIHGTHFGKSGSIALQWGPSDVATFPSTTTKGTVWRDDFISIPTDALVLSGGLTVTNDANVASAPVGLEVHGITSATIAPTPNTDAHPLALAVRGPLVPIAGQFYCDTLSPCTLFVNQEFHREFHGDDVHLPNTTFATLPAPPQAPDPGPFAVYFEHFCLGTSCSDDVDIRTQTSVLGEDVIVDLLGRVWFSEGGALLYEQRASNLDPTKQVMTQPNHSRILMFDPSTTSWRVYNLPGDRNELVGLAWDNAKSKLWFIEGGRVGGNKIGLLDPEVAKFDTASPAFDFSTDADATGYAFFDVPMAKSYPAMPLVDKDGHVWFTMYLGNAIGRLDPTTSHVDIFPLPKRKVTAGPGGLFDTGGPWRIAFLDAKESAIVFGEQYDFEITRLDAGSARAGGCTKLDAAGANPCMKSIAVDDANRVNAGALLHSILVDADRIWFTEMGTGKKDDTIGYVTTDLAHVVAFPKTDLGGPNGIATSDAQILFADFLGQKISDMHPTNIVR
jgi:streptogramin lyase